MAKTSKVRPTISIELGIEVKSKPCIKALRKRARRRAELVSADQPELAFLVDGEFIETAPLNEVDGQYVIEGPLPELVQLDIFPHEKLSSILRNDDADVEAICKALSAIKVSSELLDEVAGIMATSPTVVDDIKNIERTRGLDTGPARSFVYQKQQTFDVVVDGEVVIFNGHISRTAVSSGNSLKALVTFSRPKEGLLLKGEIDTTWGKGLDKGVQTGGHHNFRFGRLAPWQNALLQLACQMQVPVLVTVSETESTCSLRPLPIDVLKVQNWGELLNCGLAELSQAANDFDFEPEKSVGGSK